MRLIGNEGEQLGVVTIKEALMAARELTVDLVDPESLVAGAHR